MDPFLGSMVHHALEQDEAGIDDSILRDSFFGYLKYGLQSNMTETLVNRKSYIYLLMEYVTHSSS